MALLRLHTKGTHTAVVALSGDVAGDVVEELRAICSQLISRRHPDLCINLSGASSIDLDGCLALVAARQRAELLGGQLWLVRAPAEVRDALWMLGAGHLVELLE